MAANGSAEVELIEPTRDPDLNRALLDSLRRWRFFPGDGGGKPVTSTVDIRIPILGEVAVRQIALAMIEATHLLLLAYRAVVLAQDEDHASAGEWLYLAVLVAMTMALVMRHRLVRAARESA